MQGMANFQGMMQKMKKLQKDMEKAQKQIEETIFEVSDSQNLVQVKMNGKKELTDLVINEALVDPDDIDMLQDLVISTVNDAIKEVEAKTEATLGKYTKGLNLPF